MASTGKSTGRPASRANSAGWAVACALVVALVGRWLALGAGPSVPDLVRAGAKVDELVRDGDWWRLASAGLLHASAIHLAINAALLGFGLLAWVRLGRASGDDGLDRGLGAIALAVLSSVAGFGASTLAGMGASVGASAAAHGVLAAVVVGVWWRRRDLPPGLARWGPLALSAAFVAVLAVSSTAAGVDHAAHLGGVAAGLAFAPLAETRARPALIAGAAVVVATSLVAALA